MPVLSARGKRSFTYSFFILAVISIFVLGYLFYFIPHNKKTIQSNGFLILQTISQNIQNAIKGRATFYSNNYKTAMDRSQRERKATMDTLLDENNINASVSIISKGSKNNRDSTEAKTSIGNGKLVVAVADSSGTDSVVYAEPIEGFLEQFISTQKRELFHSYLFGKLGSKGSELIYHDQEVALRSDIGLDSLLPKFGSEFLSGNRDLVIQEVEMKMFYYPFKIGDAQYIICGFVDAEDYQDSLRKIPFSFIYPLAIIFLLLMISLPILKFYIMDTNEQVRLKDVMLFGVSVFLGSAFLTLMIIQFLLWKGEEDRVEDKLVNIANQVSSKFGDEVRQAYAEMQRLDTLVSDDAAASNFKWVDDEHSKADASQLVRDYLAKHNRDSFYYHFDRISWVDSSGNQRIKAELHSRPVFTKVDTRNYFKVFSRGDPYYLPGDTSKRFGWEPLYSWTNGDFNITISMRGKKYLTAMATKMPSILNVILPVGYGFCIVDEDGNVQVHSDENRNLRENFFQKISPSEKIQGAVASRQHRVVNDVVAYGKLQMMAVQPLQPKMPFYIITFYDKGHIVPVNMRILVFTLLLCLLFSFICLLLWWIIGWRNPKNNPMLFCSMDFLTWFIPKSREKTYYFHGSLYMILYVCALLGYVLLKGPSHVNNFNILALLVVTPINIIFGLYCIRTAFTLPLEGHKWQELERKRYEVLIFAGVHLLLSALVYISVPKVFSINIWFLLFQLAVNAIMWMYALSGGHSRLVTYESRRSILLGYRFLITSLVICLAVLPSSLFTWYAHNQEILQTTKRQQLYLAKEIHNRSYLINDMRGNKDTALLPDYYLDSLQFCRGIYDVDLKGITYDTCTTEPNQEETFENFYFTLAEKVSIPYYDQQSYAALNDTAYDWSWRWIRSDSGINLWYYPSFPSRNFNPDSTKKMCLHIVSEIPPRFVFLSNPRKAIPLLILVFLLLVGLFKWLGRNTEQIFLSRYIYSPRVTPSPGKTGLVAEYFEGKKITEDESMQRLYSSARYKDYSAQCDKGKLLEYEEEIVADLKNGKEFYDYVWTHCTDKEKYLLFDYAQDGLLNYKNTKEVIELLNKGLFIVQGERVRIFSPGFRAYILNSIDATDMNSIQKRYRENSSWQYVKVPLIILLIGIAALLFFTQQGAFDKLLILAGGVSTLFTLVMKFFGGGGGKKE